MKKTSVDFFESRTKVFLFLFIPTVALYAKSVGFGFTPLDEKWLIINNAEYLKLWKSLGDAFTSALYHLYYRPLLVASIFLDYRIGGLSTYVYHITNLIWHLISVFCLYRVLRLFDVQAKIAAPLSLLFSLHPMMVHAVAWVPGRNDLMLCAFTLGALIFFKKYLSDQKSWYLLLHLFLFTCALFTKENAFSLPALFFIVAYGKLAHKRLLRLAAGWVLIAGTWLVLRQAFVLPLAGSPFGFGTRLLNFFSGLLTYFGKSLFPVNQSLLPTASATSVILGLTGILVIAVLFFKPGISNRRTAFTGLLLFFILLILPLWHSSGRPDANFYEHRAYTSACGLILFFSQVKFKFQETLFRGALVIIFLIFFIKSSMRINLYKNEESFLVEALKDQPGYFLFQVQYAEILSAKGDYASALEYYNKAISLRPDKAEYYSARARVYFYLGNYNEAITDINEAIKISGFDADYYLNRCMAYNEANQVENSMKDLYVVMTCCRETVPLELQKDVGAKWRSILKALGDRIVAEPQNDKLLFDRAKMYFDTGQKQKGFADLKKAMELAPGKGEYKKLYIENGAGI